ncbi:MAG: SMI1/KNR4 family protein [Myxococcales bacterium]
MDERLLKHIRSVSSGWRSTSPGFPIGPRVDRELPLEYLDLIAVFGPGEGFIGTQYLRLLPLEQIASANAAYAVQQYLPHHLLFGSDGCGNALLFDCSASERGVLIQPFIPLNLEFTTARHPNWSAFLKTLLDVPAGFQPLTANPATHGLELHERHPVVLGGDPIDPGNKVLLPPPTHAEACVFFNKIVETARAKQRPH